MALTSPKPSVPPPVPPAASVVDDYFAGRYLLVLTLVVLHQAWFFGLVVLGRFGLLRRPEVFVPSLLGPSLLFLILAVGNTLWERWRHSPRGEAAGKAAGDWRRSLPPHVVLFDAIGLCFVSLLLGILTFMLLGLVAFRNAEG